MSIFVDLTAPNIIAPGITAPGIKNEKAQSGFVDIEKFFESFLMSFESRLKGL